MLKRVCLLTIMVLTLTIITTNRAKAQEVTVEYFYDQLAPYGHWEHVGDYGWVWQPYGTQPGWRPYSDGYWVYTEYGWTYQSNNEWGWAVYHYGRWIFLDHYGWAWVPGTEWGPAWVAWRNDDNYIGWAPLPPQVEWRSGVGLHSTNFNIDVDIHWSNWSFVELGHFDDPKIGIYIQSPARNVTFIRRTHNITRYNYENQRIINHCIDVDRWERISHRPCVRYSVVDAPSCRKVGVVRTASRPEVHVYRPRFNSQPPRTAPRQIENRHDLSSTKRYDKERSRYDKHNDQEYRRLIETQRREEASRNNNEDIQRQHDAEKNAYREQRTRDTKVLETKHVNDMDKAAQRHPGNDNKPQPQSNNNSNNRKDNAQDKNQKSNDQRQSGRR